MAAQKLLQTQLLLGSVAEKEKSNEEERKGNQSGAAIKRGSSLVGINNCCQKKVLFSPQFVVKAAIVFFIWLITRKQFISTKNWIPNPTQLLDRVDVLSQRQP